MIFNKGNSQQILSCEGCLQICNKQHTFQEQHLKISTKKIQSQLNQFMYSDDQKWGNLIMEMISKIEDIKQFIKKLEQTVYDQIIQRKIIHTLNIQHLPDQKNLISAAMQIIEGKYDKINCDQINKINFIIQKKKHNRSNIQDVFNKIQINLGQKVEQFIYKKFPSLNNIRKHDRHFIQNFNERKRQSNEKPQKISNTYNFQKNKQRINQRQIIRQQNENFQLKRNFKCENRNEYPLIKINQIQQLKGNFNIALKVLNIQKIFNIGKRQLVQFIGGDQTGQAVCVLNSSQLIKENRVLSISKCRIYYFHGTKQIQNSDESQIFLQNFQIKKIGDYNLSQRLTKDRKNQHRGKRMVRKSHIQKEKLQNNNSDRRYNNNERRQNYNERRQNYNERQRNNERRYRKDELLRSNNHQDTKNSQQMIHKNQETNNHILNSRNNELNYRKGRNNHGRQIISDMPSRQFQKQKQVIYDNKNQRHKYTKIDQIGPGDQNLCILAQIVQIQIKNENFICILGDSTAVIKASISKKYISLQKGGVFQFQNIDSVLIQDKILLKMNEKDGQIKVTNMRIPNINITQNISDIQWEQQSLQEQFEQPDNNSTFLIKKQNDSDQDLIDF